MPESGQSLKAWIYQGIAFFVLLSIMHVRGQLYGEKMMDCIFRSIVHHHALDI